MLRVSSTFASCCGDRAFCGAQRGPETQKTRAPLDLAECGRKSNGASEERALAGAGGGAPAPRKARYRILPARPAVPSWACSCRRYCRMACRSAAAGEQVADRRVRRDWHGGRFGSTRRRAQRPLAWDWRGADRGGRELGDFSTRRCAPKREPGVCDDDGLRVAHAAGLAGD